MSVIEMKTYVAEEMGYASTVTPYLSRYLDLVEGLYSIFVYCTSTFTQTYANLTYANLTFANARSFERTVNLHLLNQ